MAKRYVIEFGDVWRVDSESSPTDKVLGKRKDHVCGPHDRLAVAYDAEFGFLMKHGEAGAVRKWLDGQRERLMGGDAAAGFRSVDFPVTEDTVDLLNRLQGMDPDALLEELAGIAGRVEPPRP